MSEQYNNFNSDLYLSNELPKDGPKPYSRYNLVRGIVNVVTFVVLILMNYVAAAYGFWGGKTNAEIANEYMTYFTPAGYAFSIWGLIYTMWGLFSVYTVVCNRDSAAHEGVGWLFVAMSAANSLWLVAFAFEVFWLSTILMFTYFGLLIVMYVRLNHLESKHGRFSVLQRVFVKFTVSLQIGWINAASIAQLCIQVVSFDKSYMEEFWGISGQTWSAGTSCAVYVIAVIVLATNRDITWAMVLAWAVFAVAKRFEDVRTVEFAAHCSGAAITASCIMVALLYFRKNKDSRATSPVKELCTPLV